MSYYLYQKPAFSKTWERDPAQKNNRPVLFARDEGHAKQLREKVKHRKMSVEINPAFFDIDQTGKG